MRTNGGITMIKDWKYDCFIDRDEKLLQVYSRKARSAVSSFEGYGDFLFTYFEMVNDFEKMNLDANRIFDQLVLNGNDMPPFVNTFCSVGMVAEAFGSKIVFPKNGDFPWALHATDDIDEAIKLKPCAVLDAPYYSQSSKWIEYSKKANGTEIPFWTMDIQSPFTVAAQIMDAEELMIACYTDPEKVHQLLRTVTDYTIEMWDHHLAQMENACYPGRNFPSVRSNIGICIADDTPAIMLSEEMYREFALPYNSILGMHYGGVHIHSCGGYMRNLNSMMDITNIRSIQMHVGDGEFILPDTPEQPCGFNRARKELAILMDTNPISRTEKYADDPHAFYEEYLLPRLKTLKPAHLLMDCCVDPAKGLSAQSAADYTRQFLERAYK